MYIGIWGSGFHVRTEGHVGLQQAEFRYAYNGESNVQENET